MFQLLRSFVLAAVMFLMAPMAFAEAGDSSMSNSNAFSLELLGKGLFYSLDYDRQITPGVSLGIGFSFLTVSATTTDGTYYASGNITIVPVYLNYYFYSSGSHRYFATGGLDFLSARFSDSAITLATNVAFAGGAGY